jgi:hypothetical protein
MTNLAKWNLNLSVGITSVLTDTQLAPAGTGIASGTMSAAGSTYDNSVNLDPYIDLEVNLASLSPTAGAYVAIYVYVSEDGTNFPAQSAADLRLTSTQLLCAVPIGTTATTAQRVVVRNLLIPPKKLQFLLDNQTGVALANSGNTVKVVPYNVNLNA